MPRQITGAGKNLQARNVIKREIISSSESKAAPTSSGRPVVGSFAFRSLVVVSFFYYFMSYFIIAHTTDKVDHSMPTNHSERQEPLITCGPGAKGGSSSYVLRSV